MMRTFIEAAAWLGLLALALAFLFFRSGLDFDYVIPKRSLRLVAIVIGGICVAWCAIVFQTVTSNRILTPAVMGYEALYLLLQALLVLLAGTRSLTLPGGIGNFILSITLMLAYSWLLHRWLFRDGKHDLHLLLLLGLVLTMVMAGFTQFMQIKASPGEFAILQGAGAASFNRMPAMQLLISALMVAGVCLVGCKTLPTLDVLALGREQAISLGVDHHRQVRLQLALVAVLTAVSTSLLGPTAFMGIFVANITYALTPSSRHGDLLPRGCAIAIAAFIAAQLLVEHVFNFRTTVGILINLLCGVYFLMLMAGKRAAS